MERLHVLVIGPGLGRSEFMQGCARSALELARERDIGVVVDADGLWLLNSEPGLVRDWKGEKRVVLTPNVMEFKRLCEAMVRLLGAGLGSECSSAGRADDRTSPRPRLRRAAPSSRAPSAASRSCRRAPATQSPTARVSRPRSSRPRPTCSPSPLRAG